MCVRMLNSVAGSLAHVVGWLVGKYLFERIHFPAIELLYKLCSFKIQLFASFGHLCTLIPGALIINTGSAVPFLKNFFI